MPANEYRKPRFTFEITDEQLARCDRLLFAYGQRRMLMSIILDDLLDLLEQHGQMVAGIIMNKQLKPRECLPILNEVERKTK